MTQELIIWSVGNKTATAFFEDKEAADKFASGFGVAAGMDVMPIQVITSGDKATIDKSLLERIDDYLVQARLLEVHQKGRSQVKEIDSIRKALGEITTPKAKQ